MILSLLLVVLVAQAYSQMTNEKHTFEGYQVQEQNTCKPDCGQGECCVRMPLMMVSRKRAARAVLGGDLLGPSYPDTYNYFCQPLKLKGQRCRLNNHDQQSCDCEAGLMCTKSDDVTLSHFYGTCQ